MQSSAATDQKGQIVSRFGPTAAAYDRNQVIRACAERLLTIAAVRAGEDVLDVGCGTGLLALPAARAVGSEGRVVGIDLTPEMVAETQKKATSDGLKNVSLSLGDAEHLTQTDASFDVVICGLAVMFFPNPSIAVSEWYRVLRPGGRVVFSTWRQQFGSAALRQLLNARLTAYGLTSQNINNGQTQDPDRCRLLLVEAGFRDVEVLPEEHGFYHRNAADYWEQDVASTITAVQLDQLGTDALARFKAEHMAEVAATATAEGIWREGAVNFATGHKPA